MKKYISLIIIFVLLFTLSGCRYKGYYETKIPTDSTLRGTIKIPNEWEFITEDEVIQLIDKETKEVIAEQIVQGHFEIISNIDGNRIYNEDKLAFNEHTKYDIKNPNNYEYVKGYSNAVYKYKFSENNQEFNVLEIGIYYDNVLSDYYLMLIIYADIEDEKLEKIIQSYGFGGILGGEKDYIYDDEYKPNK